MTLAGEGIGKALHDWVHGVTGRQVIFEHPNAPRPTDEYASLHLVPQAIIGRDARVYQDQAPAEGEDLWESVQGQRRLGVSLNLYRGAVESDMGLLFSSVFSSRWSDALNADGLGFISASETRDFSAVVKSGWEERQQADFFFGTSAEAIDEVLSIQSIDIINAGTGDVIPVTQGGTP